MLGMKTYKAKRPKGRKCVTFITKGRGAAIEMSHKYG